MGKHKTTKKKASTKFVNNSVGGLPKKPPRKKRKPAQVGKNTRSQFPHVEGF